MMRFMTADYYYRLLLGLPQLKVKFERLNKIQVRTLKKGFGLISAGGTKRF